MVIAKHLWNVIAQQFFKKIYSETGRLYANNGQGRGGHVSGGNKAIFLEFLTRQQCSVNFRLSQT